jgi:hypothetical protein
MTTAAEIKKLVQPFLQRNPDLTIIGRFVFFKQVDHILRGIYVDRCGDKQAFRPIWKVDCLFRPIDAGGIGTGFGGRIYPAPEGHWYIDNPNMDKKFADILITN